MSKGADVSVATARGLSAVHLAAEAGDSALISMLLDAGVSCFCVERLRYENAVDIAEVFLVYRGLLLGRVGPPLDYAALRCERRG